ncbi:collagen-like protein [Pectobacterium cacticida]|uniref:collagen-like protein n=1 Tax=Pectobacterium cacticida TaxID=69221 RepID=UPI002FEFEA81
MPTKRTVTLNFKLSDGKTIPASFDVTDGASAYEVWKSLPANANKTEAQYLAEIKGPKGDKGDKGDTGATGAVGAKGATGATGAQGISITGVSVSIKENA